MTLGTGVFLSSIVLGFIVLYVATKDRWNWKKIVLWSLGALVLTITVGVVGEWGWDKYENRATPLKTFWDIELGMSINDVKFRKGAPTQTFIKNGKGILIYSFNRDSLYQISFLNDKVKRVEYIGPFWKGPGIKGVAMGNVIDDIQSKYGKPSNISFSKDGLDRVYCFDKYNLVVDLSADGIEWHGMYNVSDGPILHYSDAKLTDK